MAVCAEAECEATVAGPQAKYCVEHGCLRRRKRRKYIPTPEIDRVIREAYQKLRKFGNRRAIPNAAKRIGWPKWAVSRRALHLGLARTKELPWSEKEIAILEEYGWMSPERIALKLKEAGFPRTATAVSQKIKRLLILSNGDWYSANQLAEAFGADIHKITRWIRSGELKADRRGTARTNGQGGDTYVITRAAVKAFALRCPNEYDLARVEKFWFLDLITDGKICSPLRRAA